MELYTRNYWNNSDTFVSENGDGLEDLTITLNTSSVEPHGAAEVLSTADIIICAFSPIGVIGNIMNFLVFFRPAFSPLSVSIFLRHLAIMDICTIISQNTALIVRSMTTERFLSKADYRYHPVVLYVLVSFAVSSTWTIVAISIERLVAISRPLHVKMIFTKKRAFILSFSIVIAAFLLLIPMLMIEPQPEDYIPLPLYFSIVYAMVPSSIVLIANGVSIWKLHSARRRTEQIENNGISVMLIVNSLAFVLCTLAFPVYEIVDKAGKSVYNLGTVFLLISSFNHGLNIVFYGVSGSLFRQEMKELLCGKCTKKQRQQSQRTLSGSVSDEASGNNRNIRISSISSTSTLSSTLSYQP